MTMRTATLFVLCTLLTTIGLTAQSFVVMNVDSRNYPAISTRVFGFNGSGDLETIQSGANDITVREDGQVLPSQTVCPPAGTARILSLMVACDISASTQAQVLDIEKTGAKAIEAVLTNPADEAGLIGYDQHPMLQLGPTSNRPRFASAVDALQVGKGTNLTNGLNESPMGAINQLLNARYDRTLLLMTDGNTRIDVDALLSLARTFHIRIYVMGVGTPVSESLRTLATESGGTWAENIQNALEATIHARAFVADAKQLGSCTVTWTASANCNADRAIVLTRAGTTRNRSYSVPVGSRSLLDASTTGLAFGEVAVSSSATRTVTLTARNKPVTITNIVVDNPRFTITSGAVPPNVTLQPDQSHDITIRYDAQDSTGQFATITVTSDACSSQTIRAKAGFRSRDNTLRVVSPNGGETLTAGIDTIITWTGSLPDDPVRIDLSTDDGTTWASLTESATGLSYRWVPGPVQTTHAKVRIQQTVIDASKVVVLSGEQPLYTAEFVAGGTRAVTGGHDGGVNLWNAQTGEHIARLGTHGDWVSSVAGHPTQPIVASGSFDGTVRFFDIDTRQLIQTIPVGSRVWSLVFSKDGSKLYVGQDNAVTVIQNGAIAGQQTQVTGAVHSIVMNGDGTRLVCGEGQTAVIRDVNQMDVIQRFTGHTGPVYSADISPDGSTVVSGSADLTVRTWNASTGQQRTQSNPSSGSILSVRYSPNGSQILAAGGDGTAKFLDAGTLRMTNFLAGHRGLVYSARYGQNGTSVITASTDFTARIWNLGGLRLTEDVSDATFSVVGGTATGSDVDMGTVMVRNGIDKTATVVRNTGTTPLAIRSVRLASGDLTDFDMVSVPTSTMLAPGAALDVEFAFAPTAAGARSADLDIETGTGTIRTRVFGNGTLPQLQVPYLVDFGRKVANLGTNDTTIVISLPASATEAVRVTGTSLTGPASGQFSIVQGGGFFTLAPGETRSLILRFEPTDLGRFAAQVTLTTESGAPIVIKLYGEGSGDATISTVQSVVFDVDACNSTPVERTITVSNTGNSSLLLFEARVAGLNASEFTITPVGSVQFPLELAAKAKQDFIIRFTPMIPGIRTAQAIFTSTAMNAIGGETYTQLVARKDSIGFELTRPVVAFDNVPENTPATETFQILNTGTVSLRWPKGPIELGTFRIESILPDVTPPGGISTVVVRFRGGTAGNAYTASYTFMDSTCNHNQTLQFRATVSTYIGVLLRADTMRVLTDRGIDVPVYITDKVNLDRTTVRDIDVDVIVNATLLMPSGQTPVGTVSNGMRTIPVRITIPAGNDSLATTLRFHSLWGNDTASTVAFTNIRVADTILVRTQPGQVILDDLCRQGGPRLIKLAAQGAGIHVSPQPATGPATIDVAVVERGHTTVTVVDMTGRTLATIVDRYLQPGVYRLPIDVTTMSNGAYYILMTTPTERRSQRLEISK